MSVRGEGLVTTELSSGPADWVYVPGTVYSGRAVRMGQSTCRQADMGTRSRRGLVPTGIPTLILGKITVPPPSRL